VSLTKETIDKIALGVSVIGLLVAGVAVYESHEANEYSRQANDRAREANQLANKVAAQAGALLRMESPVVNVWDPSKNVNIPFQGTATPTPISPEAWAASPPDRRTLTVTLINDGQEEAHIAQPGLVTRTSLPGVLLKDGFSHNDPTVETVLEDPNGLKPLCSRGTGEGAPCSPTLAAHDAEIMTIALPEQYVHDVDPADRDRGIIFSLFVAAQEKTLLTNIVIPHAAFGR
jgi:hypothetical protein